MMKNQCIDSEHGGYGTELESVLEAIEVQQIYDPVTLKEHFGKMFVVDALLEILTGITGTGELL